MKDRIINTHKHLVGTGIENMEVADFEKYEQNKRMNFDSTQMKDFIKASHYGLGASRSNIQKI